jgi:lipoyl(octanoyl) transferase
MRQRRRVKPVRPNDASLDMLGKATARLWQALGGRGEPCRRAWRGRGTDRAPLGVSWQGVPDGAPSELQVCQLGLVDYREAVQLQQRLRARRQAEEIGDVLLLLEHPPVYTRGRRSDPGELAMGEAWYRSQGIDVVETDRGGRVTYHGPGQLVGYPILRVADVIAHVRTLEAAIVAALAEAGVTGRARTEDGADYTGVWVSERKIASIGVHLARGVSTHGFAVNVENDLQPFEWVVPCGLEGVRMTSLIRERGDAAPGALPAFAETMAACFARALGRTPRTVELRMLDPATVPSG